MAPEEIVSQLRELAAVCRQDERGYLQAAEAIPSSQLQQGLRHYSRQRSRMTAELDEHVARITGMRLPATLQWFGAWADVDALAHGCETAVLDECARSEAITRERFERALKRDLPLNIRMVVHRQYTEVKAALRWLRHAQMEARNHSYHET